MRAKIVCFSPAPHVKLPRPLHVRVHAYVMTICIDIIDYVVYNIYVMTNELNMSCAVCLEALKDPKVLPCCHSFCKCCLKGIIDKSLQKEKLACPQCRALHAVCTVFIMA